jgi:hypothetical protein
MPYLSELPTLTKIQENDLIDLARNVAGFDDHWLLVAGVPSLKAALLEFRDQARKALDIREPEVRPSQDMAEGSDW